MTCVCNTNIHGRVHKNRFITFVIIHVTQNSKYKGRLIDFYYIGSDVASDDPDVFNEEESGETWFGAEGLLLRA